MEITLIVIFVIFLFMGLFAFKLLPVSKIAIIEHLGAYQKTIDQPGIIFIKPLIEKMHVIDRLTTVEVKSESISLNGHKDFDVTFDLTYEVLQAKTYFYLEKGPSGSLKDLCLKEIRIYLSEHTVYDILETKNELKKHLIDFMQKQEASYGIKFQNLDMIALIKHR